jgi:hypothetical protein
MSVSKALIGLKMVTGPVTDKNTCVEVKSTRAKNPFVTIGRLAIHLFKNVATQQTKNPLGPASLAA